MRLDMTNWLDKEEAADYIGCHEMHIWRLVRRGELPSATYLTGKQGLWHRDALDRYLDQKLAIGAHTLTVWKGQPA